MELRNASEHQFTDISSEEYREYYFGSHVEKIDAPQYLAVSASGGHRLLDGVGVSHYIPAGWHRLSWKAKDGKPHFVK